MFTIDPKASTNHMVFVQLALCVIAKAGFGQDVHWADDIPPPAGHKLTFLYSLKVFTENIFLSLIMPRWAWGLRERWRHVKLANEELGVSLKSLCGCVYTDGTPA